MNCTRVSISVSEPWELGESMKWHAIRGQILRSVKDSCGGRALVKLDQAIDYRGSAWKYVVAESRHEGKQLDALQVGERLICGFTGISDDEANADSSLDAANWRGGLAFIGDFEPTP